MRCGAIGSACSSPPRVIRGAEGVLYSLERQLPGVLKPEGSPPSVPLALA